MSAGQRHLLFLALRLASLERHFEHSESMSLVLDDLLAQLDDTRARAALEILSEMARTTQVLLLNHHHHLVSMARDVVPGSCSLSIRSAARVTPRSAPRDTPGVDASSEEAPLIPRLHHRERAEQCPVASSRAREERGTL